jgi:hypothetical protein
MGIKQRDFVKKKALALKLLQDKPGLSIRDLQNLSGLSYSSAQRVRANATQGVSKEPVPQVEPLQKPETPTSSLDFQESPVPIDDKKKSIVDQGLDSIKGMLGIKDVKGEKKAAPPLTAKLDPKRQAFVDNVTPTIALGFIIMAGAWWQRIGPEYKALTPDEEAATRIVAPLVRIYARHATFLTEINPDWADAGASLFAFVAYVYTSLGLYQKIKEEKEAANEQQGTYGYREYRNGASAENGAYHASSGYADVSGAGENNVGGSSENGRAPQGVSRAHLAPKEQRQFEALSRLSELDYASRTRRSGYIQ